MKTSPVSVRGTVYPSQAAAARALGLSKNTIFQALERGRLDLAGLGIWGRAGHPCRINDQNFPSQTAAAQALGVRVSSIGRAIAAGRDTVRTKQHRGSK